MIPSGSSKLQARIQSNASRIEKSTSQSRLENRIACPFSSLKGTYIESLSDDAINLVIECSAQPPSSCGVVVGLDHYVHGQVCRVAPDATAFGLRKAGAIHMTFWVVWKEKAQASACMAWSKSMLEQFRQYSGGRVFANYMSAMVRPSQKVLTAATTRDCRN